MEIVKIPKRDLQAINEITKIRNCWHLLMNIGVDVCGFQLRNKEK